MNKRYYITEEQLDEIIHFRNLFDFTKEQIKWLCEHERDDIVYGFELGQIYSNLSKFNVDTMKLEDKIYKQTIEDERN